VTAPTAGQPAGAGQLGSPGPAGRGADRSVLRFLPALTLVAVVTVTSTSEWTLARTVLDLPPAVAWAVPVAIDSYVVAALRTRRDVLPAVVVMAGALAAAMGAHLAAAERPDGTLPTTVTAPAAAVILSVLVIVAWRVHVLIDHLTISSTALPSTAVLTVVPASTTPAAAPTPHVAAGASTHTPVVQPVDVEPRHAPHPGAAAAGTGRAAGYGGGCAHPPQTTPPPPNTAPPRADRTQVERDHRRDQDRTVRRADRGRTERRQPRHPRTEADLRHRPVPSQPDPPADHRRTDHQQHDNDPEPDQEEHRGPPAGKRFSHQRRIQPGKDRQHRSDDLRNQEPRNTHRHHRPSRAVEPDGGNRRRGRRGHFLGSCSAGRWCLMLSISSGHSASYLTGSVGAGMESYYTGACNGGEPPGRWSGIGAVRLGLAGEVDGDQMDALYEQFLDPRDPAFADPETRTQAAVLGRAPKRFRTPEQVLADRVEAYSSEYGSTPTPEQVQAWRIEAERDTPKAVAFLDLTFSPVKSVTVLHTAYSRAAVEAETDGNLADAELWRGKVAAIDDAIAEANDAMLAWMADQAGYARTGRHGGTSTSGRWVDAHDWVVASFYQHTSRDLDPQLHVHNAVLNRVECPDGTWRALDSRAIHRALQGGSAVGSAVLRERLSAELGVAWVMREDGNDFEIATVDPAAVDLFSSRRHTTTAKAEDLFAAAEARYGRPLNSLERSRLQQQAALATRRAKTHRGETRNEMLDRWNAELSEVVAGTLLRLAEQHRDPATAAALARAAGVIAAGDHSWSESSVIKQALEACHGTCDTPGRATWGASELTRQILLALPPTLDLPTEEQVALARTLTEKALAEAVQTSGRELGRVPGTDRLENGADAAMAPGAARYAAPGHLAAEDAILRSAGTRGRLALDSEQVTAWLDGTEQGSALSPAQREAVLGIAGSDAALAVLVGPAGTGKSFTAGTLAAAWGDLAGGRVIGLATAETAAQVLVEDGLADSANLTRFLAAQDRLSAGRGTPEDERWRITPDDMVVIDEASMVDTAPLRQVHQLVESAGARLVLMGDPAQLGAVGAGGMMRTAIAHQAETYTLSAVRRFTHGWEGDASLALRDGRADAVEEYDRHGRVIDAGRQADAIAAVARAAAADRVDGREVLVSCTTNDDAATVASSVRRHLVEAGLVEEAGTMLGRDGCTAGIGDVVQARRIDHSLGLVNRHTYTVTRVGEDGSLQVTSTRTGALIEVPADYVEADLTLAYASTVHAAQGATVDAGHVLLRPGTPLPHLYVALTRGREQNTVWAITDDGIESEPVRTGRGMLAEAIQDEIDQAGVSATDDAAADAQWRSHAGTLLGALEEDARTACRVRLEADLDRLVSDGELSEVDRARFGADQGTEHLSRQLRALEQAGHDPAQVLREAIAERPLTTATFVGQTVASRIDKAHGLPVPQPAAWGRPDRLPEPQTARLHDLAGLLGGRAHDLGEQAATECPSWATSVLGPVPEDAGQRQTWVEQAGQIAAAREATGWTDPEHALGRAPGVHSPEQRALWHDAYTAAGAPPERRPDADLTDGRLLVRIAAGERVKTTAPPAVYDAQRERHQAAERARHEAILAEAAGRADDAAREAADAAAEAEAAARLDQVAQARGEWLVAHGHTLAAAESAREEAIRRGLDVGHEPDRRTTAEYLADLEAERDAERADDDHRDLAEADLYDPTRDAAQDDATTASEPKAGRAVDEQRKPSHLSAAASAAEIRAAAIAAEHAQEQLADQQSQDAAEPAADDEWLRRRHLEQVATAETEAADAADL
jgi:conjugative relaxase-like TrwC/TraI family protein